MSALKLGTRALARQARAEYRKADLDLNADWGDFEVIDWGCSRVALRGPDELVYKVETRRNNRATKYEAEVFELLDKLGLPYCPDFRVFLPERVVVMPFYKDLPSWGAYDQWAKENPEVPSALWDMGKHNLGVREDGQYVIRDGGAGLRDNGKQRLSERSSRGQQS